MFWFHGGGLFSGVSSDYDPSAIAQLGIVVITSNYRLAILDYFANSALGDSADYGMLDQLFALGWMKRNIAAFGGDPAKVTILGESGGADSATMLLASPRAAGLYRGVILESFSRSPAV